MYLTNRRSSSQKRQWSMTAVSLCKTVLNCFARASKPTGTLPPPSLLGMMEQNTTTLPEPQNLPKSSAAMVSGDTDKLQMLLPPHNTTTTSCFCDIGCCKYTQKLVNSVKPIFLTVENQPHVEFGSHIFVNNTSHKVPFKNLNHEWVECSAGSIHKILVILISLFVKLQVHSQNMYYQ